MSEISVVMAREEIPGEPSVFLAGPTPERGSGMPSWRPDAVVECAARWSDPRPLCVLSPESRGGIRADRYEAQVAWEFAARAAATVILFWIPRDMAAMPALTTNVEFGLDVDTGRVVLGCPSGCPSADRNRYLVYLAGRYGVPVRQTLPDTVTAALDMVMRRCMS